MHGHLLAALLCAITPLLQDPAPPRVAKHLDVPYHRVEGAEARLTCLDVYAPESGEGLPILVMIHGGGWRLGDKARGGMTRYKVPHFTGAGYVYVSINYRLSPAVRHPVHVQDVARALGWIHDHAREVGGDPDRIFVMGHSAGAHLAALVATDERRLQEVGKDLSILKGAVLLDSAAYDLPRYADELGAPAAATRMYRTAFGPPGPAWRDASPRHHVEAGKGIPPFLILHTGLRRTGATLSRELAEALVAAGTPARAVHAADRNHSGLNRGIGEPGDPYTALVMDFLAEHGEPEPPPFADDIRALRGILESRWSYLEHRRELDGLDLDALEAEALELLGEEPDERAFLLALTRYVAGLRDGHADVFYEGLSLQEVWRWPFLLAEDAEGVFVLAVAGNPGPRPGDSVLAVDGEPIESLLLASEKLCLASTDGARRAAALRSLPASTGRERLRVKLRRRDGDGEAEELEVACVPAGTWIPSPRPRLQETETRVIEPGIGYFRPGSFRPPADSPWAAATPKERERILEDSYRRLAESVESLARAEVLILDLRGNPGGTDLLGEELAGLLLEPEAVYFQLQSRGVFGWWRAAHPYPVRSQPGRDPWRGGLVCLIDEGVFSTADNFAACLRDNRPDAVFIGRPTGAGTGAPRGVELPGTGAWVIFCTMRVYSPDGEMIEGVGVKPDVPVGWTREDYLEGRDPDLEAALEIARSKL